MAARFDEAIRLAEEAFTSELAKLVSHLGERLSGQEDGKPKVFRDSAVENLQEFFQRFRSLNVGSSQQLDELVAQAQRVVSGVDPQALRTNVVLRQEVATQLAGGGLRAGRPDGRPAAAEHFAPAQVSEEHDADCCLSRWLALHAVRRSDRLGGIRRACRFAEPAMSSRMNRGAGALILRP